VAAANGNMSVPLASDPTLSCKLLDMVAILGQALISRHTADPCRRGDARRERTVRSVY